MLELTYRMVLRILGEGRFKKPVYIEYNLPAIGKHSLEVCYEEPLVHIVICLQPFCHGFHVHGELHMLIVVRYSLPVHWIKEWP